MTRRETNPLNDQRTRSTRRLASGGCAIAARVIILAVIMAGWWPGRLFAQDLDDSWTVTVNGQVVPVRADGSFEIPNISAPDFLPYGYTPSGLFLPGDFIGDDFLRVIAHSSKGGTNRYAVSEFFRIRQGGVYSITNLFFSDIPPRKPEAIGVVPDTATLTSLGQTTQVRVTARYADGSVYDVSPRSRFTSYRVSNPAIATLDDDGLLTARAKGMVYVTAMNEGVAGVAQVDVSPGDPLTTLSGVIQTSNGVPAGGAIITIAGQAGKLAVTRADGSFVLTNVATGFGPPDLLVEFSDGGNCYRAVVPQVPLLPGAVSDAGLIVVNMVVNPSGLVAWWPGDGNAEDLLLGNNGSLQNGAAFANGMVAQAFSLDGVDDSVDLGSSFTRQTFSIAFWVNPSVQPTALANILDNNHSHSQGWTLEQDASVPGLWRWFVADGIGDQIINVRLDSNVWQHVAFIRDTNRVNRCYKDGIEIGSTTNAAPIPYLQPHLYIGRWAAGGRYWKGLLDELTLFNRALTANEIAGIYAAGSLGLCKAFPPRALVLSPTNGAIVGASNSVSVTFNRSLAPASVTPGAFTLTTAGPDLRLDTPDDQLLTTGQLSYNDALKTAFLSFTNGLPPGLYRASISSNILSLTGKPLENPSIWSFWILSGGETGDADGDGVTNRTEITLGLNPLNKDTDGDGWEDGDEIDNGTEPLNPNSRPMQTLLAYPLVLVDLPSPEASGTNGVGVIVAHPPVQVDLPSPDVAGTNSPGLFLGKPPVWIKLPTH